MNTQQLLSNFGKPIQDVVRFSSSQGYGIGLRTFALFLLYRDDWERMFRYPGAPGSAQGAIMISRREHDLLASTAARVLSAPEITPFILGKRPANVALKTTRDRGAYVLAIQGSRALAICAAPVRHHAESIVLGVSRVLEKVAPTITQITLLSVSPSGEFEITQKPVRDPDTLPIARAAM